MIFSLVYSLYAGDLNSINAAWLWPGGYDWHFANPGDRIITDCKNWYNAIKPVIVVRKCPY